MAETAAARMDALTIEAVTGRFAALYEQLAGRPAYVDA
jgi:hypothetical protein